MKIKLKGWITTLLRRLFGIKIVIIKNIPQEEQSKYKKKYVHDPAYSYMVSPSHKEMLIEELREYADNFFNYGYFSSGSEINTDSLIRDFFDIYCGRKLTDNTHGSGFHNSFWIYLIAKALNPTLVVESGVLKGHTTWLLEQACPKADLFGFDITLDYIEYKNLNAQLLEQDWNTFQFPEFNPENGLVFFDCHVNHAQRILEAKAKGFKHLLFDDNPPVHKIFSHIPGIPTASMINSGIGIESPDVSWVWNGKKKTRSINLNEVNQAKELIKIHHVLPDVGGPTRYGGFAFLTYVQI